MIADSLTLSLSATVYITNLFGLFCLRVRPTPPATITPLPLPPLSLMITSLKVPVEAATAAAGAKSKAVSQTGPNQTPTKVPKSCATFPQWQDGEGGVRWHAPSQQ